MNSLYNYLAQASVYKLYVILRLNRVLYNLFFHLSCHYQSDVTVMSQKKNSIPMPPYCWPFQIKSVVSCLFHYFWTTHVYQDLWFACAIIQPISCQLYGISNFYLFVPPYLLHFLPLTLCLFLKKYGNFTITL